MLRLIVIRSVSALFLFTLCLSEVTAFPDISELQNKLDETLSPKAGKHCQLDEGPKDLTSVKEVSLRSCFSEYNKAKVDGTRVLLGSFRCEVPIDFLINCGKKDWEKASYRNIKVKGLDINFANTKSSSHIPPRGWTTKIVLDKYEEESQEGPTPQLIEISCYSGEKMMSLKDFQRVFEDTIRFK